MFQRWSWTWVGFAWWKGDQRALEFVIFYGDVIMMSSAQGSTIGAAHPIGFIIWRRRCPRPVVVDGQNIAIKFWC